MCSGPWSCVPEVLKLIPITTASKIKELMSPSGLAQSNFAMGGPNVVSELFVFLKSFQDATGSIYNTHLETKHKMSEFHIYI